MTTDENPMGKWAARIKNGRQNSLYHKIESLIADRWVASCGKQMERVTDDGTMTILTTTSTLYCSVCH